MNFNNNNKYGNYNNNYPNMQNFNPILMNQMMMMNQMNPFQMMHMNY